MNILETEWWTIAVPSEWWADQEEETILIGDRDDVGCIEITTLCKDKGNFYEAEVRGIADSDREVNVAWEPVGLNGFEGLHGVYQEEESSIREWYLSTGGLLLFVSYCCENENQGMDDAAVNEILDTLEVLEQRTE